MSKQSVEFYCPVCRQKESVAFHPPQGFMLSAYEYAVSWYNYNFTHEADLEEINFENLLLLNETPECARKYMVRAEFPFSGEIDQNYCVFFTPAMIRMNGWDEQWVEEIDKVAFVDFKIESILLNEYDHAWITVIVEQVYLLNNLHTSLPARTNCSVLSKLGE